MSNYIKPIITAIVTFPFIALLFTIPYIIFQYRKYGAIPLLRVLVVYSFILYLISAYFLVILPLPSQEFVNSLKTPTTQLIPFTFVKDFIEHTSLVISNPSTYIPALKEPYFYQVLYNIFLTLPFGIYLRYYFKFSLKKTIISSFFLSLFFELTQLSGLYGIYSRSYRLFDVDDLMINTIGGALGYLLEPILLLVLPTRDKIDEMAYKKGEKVSFLRRLVAFNLDFVSFILMSTILIILVPSHIRMSAIFVSAVVYYILIPLATNGQTLGKKFLNIKVVKTNGEKATSIQVIMRYAIQYLVYIPFPYYIIYLLENGNIASSGFFEVALLLIMVVIPIIYISIFIKAAIKKQPLLYEKISKTKNASTIKSQFTKDEAKNEEIENKINTNQQNHDKSKVKSNSKDNDNPNTNHDINVNEMPLK